jgi:hypothetical protein
VWGKYLPSGDTVPYPTPPIGTDASRRLVMPVGVGIDTANRVCASVTNSL